MTLCYKSPKEKSREKEKKLQTLRNEYNGSKRAFKLRQVINPLLLHKLVDWVEKTARARKKKYVQCNFQEIVELLGVSARHARKVVECARDKGFVQTERHGYDYYIYRMKYIERLIGFKRTVWNLYWKHQDKIREHAPDLYKKMVYYIKNCRKKEKDEAVLSLGAVDKLPLGVMEDIFKLLLSLKALFSKNSNFIFKIYGEVTNFLVKMEDDCILKIGYLGHVMDKAKENITRFVIPGTYKKQQIRNKSKRNNLNYVGFWKFLFLICGNKSLFSFIKRVPEGISIYANTIYYATLKRKRDWHVLAKNSIYNLLWNIRRFGSITIKPWSFTTEVRYHVDKFLQECTYVHMDRNVSQQNRGMKRLADILHDIVPVQTCNQLSLFHEYLVSHKKSILKNIKPSLVVSFYEICDFGSYAIKYLESRCLDS